eukprot:TRINITY_DN3655_c0_g1_i4.p3 TRINITY_DN3655_c0_g1~~TRINITY_DN3655_c0_g1_i4.p3  ORF type:complete len:145 (+),score=7.28 TRINITY_DN3655_c0_g1_i4:596-1030(+)
MPGEEDLEAARASTMWDSIITCPSSIKLAAVDANTAVCDANLKEREGPESPRLISESYSPPPPLPCGAGGDLSARNLYWRMCSCAVITTLNQRKHHAFWCALCPLASHVRLVGRRHISDRVPPLRQSCRGCVAATSSCSSGSAK